VSDHLKNLQQKIYRGIPLSEAMEFEISELTPNSILVQAPLAPNVNVHGTGFAGSIYSIAVLSGWALCTHIMEVRGMKGDLVVAGAEIKYRAPVTGDFSCISKASEADCQAFQADFESNGKGRLVLSVDVGDVPNAVLVGSYYAVARG
jgi:thioesterase domain-containing protein